MKITKLVLYKYEGDSEDIFETSDYDEIKKISELNMICADNLIHIGDELYRSKEVHLTFEDNQEFIIYIGVEYLGNENDL